MAKRPDFNWTAPTVFSTTDKEEIETLDVMWSLQYGGTHIRTMLQNLAKKRRGTGTRRFNISVWPQDEYYGTLELDEYTNPIIKAGSSQAQYPKMKNGRYDYNAKPTIKSDCELYMRFEQDGIFIQSIKIPSYSIRSFLNEVVTAYTQYNSSGGYYGGSSWNYVGNASQKASPNLHQPVGNAVTKIESTLCNDKSCLMCPPIKALIKPLKQFNTDLKTAKKQPSTASSLPRSIKSFVSGYVLPYNDTPNKHPWVVENNFDRIKKANAK